MGAPDLSKNLVCQILEGDGYVTLKLTGQLDGTNLGTIQSDFQAFLKDPFPYVIVNCEACSFLSADWMRVFLQLQAELKRHNKQMAFISIQAVLKALFKKAGVDSAFKEGANLHEVLAGWGLATKKRLDTDFINPFLEATIKVLKIQTQTEATPGKIYVKKASDKFTGDVSGVIGIVSESFNGSVVISFPEKTFVALMSNMLGETYTTLTPEILDGAGEITNMVFGQAKVVLNGKGYGIKTALPSVVSGKDHSLTALTKGPCVVVPFQSSAGDFFVEICLSV